MLTPCRLSLRFIKYVKLRLIWMLLREKLFESIFLIQGKVSSSSGFPTANSIDQYWNLHVGGNISSEKFCYLEWKKNLFHFHLYNDVWCSLYTFHHHHLKQLYQMHLRPHHENQFRLFILIFILLLFLIIFLLLSICFSLHILLAPRYWWVESWTFFALYSSSWYKHSWIDQSV